MYLKHLFAQWISSMCFLVGNSNAVVYVQRCHIWWFAGGSQSEHELFIIIIIIIKLCLRFKVSCSLLNDLLLSVAGATTTLTLYGLHYKNRWSKGTTQKNGLRCCCCCCRRRHCCPIKIGCSLASSFYHWNGTEMYLTKRLLSLNIL